jgi:hypothetical protein
MKPKMRQKATRKKSRRQKATRRTCKQVIKGGDPSNIGIIWENGIFEKKHTDKQIHKKIDEYLDIILSKIKSYADKELLKHWLRKAGEAINEFETKQPGMYTAAHKEYVVSMLRLKARGINNEIDRAILGIEKENTTYKNYIPISRTPLVPERGPKLDSTLRARSNNLRSTKFNNMTFSNIMGTLKKQQEAAQKPLISQSEKEILSAL